MTTEKQRTASRAGLRAQRRAKRWLEKHHWKDVVSTHPGPFDLEGKKNGEFWLIESKSGDRPPVRIMNLVRMLEEKRDERVDKLGLIFVPNRVKVPLLLFTMDKRSYVAFKASIKRRSSQAANKAWRTRRRSE